MRSGDKYTPENCDQTFEIPNRKNDPIDSIKISGDFFSNYNATISFGGSWYSRVGAKLEVSGDPTTTKDANKKFEELFDKERGIPETALSLNPFIQSFLICILMHAGLGMLDPAFLLKLTKDGYAILLPYIALFWLVPLFGLAWLAEYGTFKFFGRAVFLWDDGLTRFEKRKKIATFFFWTVPIAIVIKIAASHWS
jgi:hypothetical protein